MMREVTVFLGIHCSTVSRTVSKAVNAQNLTPDSGFTLYLVNNRMLVGDDFYPDEKDGSVYLKREAMKKYFAEYEKYLGREFKHSQTGEATSLRKCFRVQAENLAGFINGAPAYSPFRLEE